MKEYRQVKCCRCDGTGKITDWPSWEPKGRRMTCPACKGKGLIRFEFPKKLRKGG